ncbi:MAG: hypothetical protein AAGJ18_07255, partial [Bacteroidota bacterium]
MNQKKSIIQLILLAIPMMALGQSPATSKLQKDQFTFQQPKKKQTRFRQQYEGSINGRPMQLGFVEKMLNDQLTLTVILTDVQQKKVYLGETNIDKKDHHLQRVMLQDQLKDTVIISDLFRHLYNSNFLNLIMADGQVGYFAWQMVNTSMRDNQPKAFKNQNDYLGSYMGRLNGRLAVLRMAKEAEKMIIELSDEEQK